MKYRDKKNTIRTIKAFQYDGDLIDRNGKSYVPKWVMTLKDRGILHYNDQGDLHLNYGPKIEVGEYIMLYNGGGGVNTMSKEEFESHYEPADELERTLLENERLKKRMKKMTETIVNHNKKIVELTKDLDLLKDGRDFTVTKLKMEVERLTDFNAKLQIQRDELQTIVNDVAEIIDRG